MRSVHAALLRKVAESSQRTRTRSREERAAGITFARDPEFPRYASWRRPELFGEFYAEAFERDAMVQYAVTLKNGDWTVFCDGQPLERGLSRSAAIQMAKDLAFEAEERGDSVELLIQGYYGDMSRRLSGGADD
jgi:hypothetical protein